MMFSDWLKPVYEGVPEILAGLPVRLETWDQLLASGNPNSTQAPGIYNFDEPNSLPFASVKQFGRGYVVFICALVTGDAWLEGCLHNTRWLVNLAQFLTKEADKETQRVQSAVKSELSLFLSHAHEDKPLVNELYRLLTFEYVISAWLDIHEMVPGDSLPDHIADGIRSASFFILIWSQAASESEWVRRELELASSNKGLTIIVVRLDGAEVPRHLSNLLHIEAFADASSDIAKQIIRTIEKHQLRKRIEAVEGQVAEAVRLADEKKNTAIATIPEGASLTRRSAQSETDHAKSISVAGTLPDIVKLAELHSDYRIDILSFLSDGTLLSGSSRFDQNDIADARKSNLITDFRQVNCPTGMDGHLDEHVPSQRYLLYGYHDMKIVDRSTGDTLATVECDSSASVHSAAWSPTGDKVIVGSTNYLTIASDTGDVLLHSNLFEPRTNSSAKSVVWQPSLNPIYASDTHVCIVDENGTLLRELSNLESLVVAVAISPCSRYIAASSKSGQIGVWNEAGTLLALFKGFGSQYWHASRCLAFSLDSRFLVQAATSDSQGFLVLEMNTGKTAKVTRSNTDLVAMHPTLNNVFVTAADDTIFFWRFP